MSEQKVNALRQFADRKDYSSLLQRVDTHGIHAQDPNYLYCKHCGTPTEVLTKETIFEPYAECSQCKGLHERGWMQDAIRHYEGE